MKYLLGAVIVGLCGLIVRQALPDSPLETRVLATVAAALAIHAIPLALRRAWRGFLMFTAGAGRGYHDTRDSRRP